MSKFLNWKNAPATSNIAIFVPGVPNGGLVFAIEDEQGNVTSCKDGSIFSNFTVAGRRPLATQKTPAQTGNIWSVDEYEQLGLIIVKGDKVTSSSREVIGFAWRHHETDQPRDDYQGAVELDDSGYWRPLVMQNPRLPVVTETPAQPGTDDTDYRNAHFSKYVELGLLIENTDEVDENGIVSEFSWRHYEADQSRKAYKGEIETEGEYWRPVIIRELKNDSTDERLMQVPTGPTVSKEEQLQYLVTMWSEWVSTHDFIIMSYNIVGHGAVNKNSLGHKITKDEWTEARKKVADQTPQWNWNAFKPGSLTEEQKTAFTKAWEGAWNTPIHPFGELQYNTPDELRTHIKIKNAGAYGEHSIITSVDILNQAVKEQGDRAATYDAPSGERSMGKTVAMFNILTGFNVTEEQGWQFMELLKMVRSSQGKAKADNYVDGSGYASLAGESALRDRGDKS